MIVKITNTVGGYLFFDNIEEIGNPFEGMFYCWKERK